MNLVVIPFHDWRKITKEGFRTRDAHFIESFTNSNDVNKLIIINRPTTIAEILLKRKKRKILGKLILNENGFALHETCDNVFVIDFISKDIVGQALKKFRWFIEEYGNDQFIKFINKSLKTLKVNNYNLISQNIFAHKLYSNLRPKIRLFDAWDNFCLIDDYENIIGEIESAYSSYAKTSDFWVTNSRDNISYFSKHKILKKIHLIKNGVDLKRFNLSNAYELPEDLKNMKKPVIGFGGKITQTINVDWLNFCIENNPNASFVIIGQILDKKIFNSITKSPNFFYLGDKFYDEYPNYVNAFDICLVPYHIEEEKKSGTNPIKVYEYLALNKKVIGTNGNGLEDLKNYLFLVDDKFTMSQEISKGVLSAKPLFNLKKNSWDTKAKELIALMK